MNQTFEPPLSSHLEPRHSAGALAARSDVGCVRVILDRSSQRCRRCTRPEPQSRPLFQCFLYMTRTIGVGVVGLPVRGAFKYVENRRGRFQIWLATPCRMGTPTETHCPCPPPPPPIVGKHGWKTLSAPSRLSNPMMDFGVPG